MSAGETARTLQQPFELPLEVANRPAAVLIVHTDHERDQIERTLGFVLVDGVGKFVRGPGRTRDDVEVGDLDAIGTQQLDQLIRPSFGVSHSLADCIGITQREKALHSG